jgi:hypothetical protein
MTTGNDNPLLGYNPVSFGSPSPQDVVIIQGETCPGICTIDGFKRKWKWDAKGGKGSPVETVTYTMKHASVGTLTFWVWTGLQFQQWDLFLPLFKYDPLRKDLQAVTIDNPMLSDLEIHSIVCTSVSPFTHVDEGLWRREVEVIEWHPVVKGNVTSTPTTAKTGTAGTSTAAAPSPLSPLQQRLANAIAANQAA